MPLERNPAFFSLLLLVIVLSFQLMDISLTHLLSRICIALLCIIERFLNEVLPRSVGVFTFSLFFHHSFSCVVDIQPSWCSVVEELFIFGT